MAMGGPETVAPPAWSRARPSLWRFADAGWRLPAEKDSHAHQCSQSDQRYRRRSEESRDNLACSRRNRWSDHDKLHPEQVERLNKAFELALRSLGFDRNDPKVDIVAKKILEIATTAIRDPREIADTAIRQLAAKYPRRD